MNTVFQGAVMASILMAVAGDVGPGPGPGVKADPIPRDSASGQGFTATMPLIANGDFLLAYLSGGEATDPGWSSSPTGWTLLETLDNSRGNSALFYRVADGTEGATVAFTPDAGGEDNCTYIVLSVANVDTSDPFSQTPEVSTFQQQSNTTVATVPDTVVDEAGEFVVAFVTGGWSGGFSYLPPTGWTEFADVESVTAADNGNTASAAYLTSAPVGTITGESFTCSVGLHQNVMSLSLNRGEPLGITAHRYWSLLVNAVSGDPSFTSLGQVEFYEYPDGFDRVPEDLATSNVLASNASRSEYIFDNHATEPGLGDINSAFYWQDSGISGTFVGFDFGDGNDIAIQGFMLQSRDQQFDETPSNVTLRYSDDGISWTNVETFELGQYTGPGEIKTASIATASPQPHQEIPALSAHVVTSPPTDQQVADIVRVYVVVTP